MNANEIINDSDLTLEEKLEAIDIAVQTAQFNHQ